MQNWQFFPLIVQVCPALISVWDYEIYRANSLCGDVTQHVTLEPSPGECCVTSLNRHPLDGDLNTGFRRKEYGRRNFQRRETYFIHVLGNMEKPLLSVLVSLGVPELLCNSVTPVRIQEIAEQTGCHTDEKVYKV